MNFDAHLALNLLKPNLDKGFSAKKTY